MRHITSAASLAVACAASIAYAGEQPVQLEFSTVCVGIGGCATSASQSPITTDGVFYQNPLGNDLPPSASIIQALPETAEDTYVSFDGGKTNGLAMPSTDNYTAAARTINLDLQFTDNTAQFLLVEGPTGPRFESTVTRVFGDFQLDVIFIGRFVVQGGSGAVTTPSGIEVFAFAPGAVSLGAVVLQLGQENAVDVFGTPGFIHVDQSQGEFGTINDLYIAVNPVFLGSCKGLCDTNAGFSCSCLADCCAFEDCCPDVLDSCGYCPPPVGCDGFCGEQSPDGCFCSLTCFAYGDCCDDVCNACPDFTPCIPNLDLLEINTACVGLGPGCSTSAGDSPITTDGIFYQSPDNNDQPPNELAIQALGNSLQEDTYLAFDGAIFNGEAAPSSPNYTSASRAINLQVSITDNQASFLVGEGPIGPRFALQKPRTFGLLQANVVFIGRLTVIGGSGDIEFPAGLEVFGFQAGSTGTPLPALLQVGPENAVNLDGQPTFIHIEQSQGDNGTINDIYIASNPVLLPACPGFCGGMSEFGCNCDQSCCAFNDCCTDAETTCNFTCPQTCQGFCDATSSGGCSCSDECCVFKDCCDDIFDVCGYCPPPVGCDGFCGEQSPDGCSCQELCCAFQDCCQDAESICRFECAESCTGSCGGQTATGCFCDDFCCLYLDCCEDVATVCGVDCDGGSGGKCPGFCGGQSTAACFCDDLCCIYVDCCEDVEIFCGVSCGGGGGDNDCKGFCSGQAAAGCFCDENCCVYADCCSDVLRTCGIDCRGGADKCPDDITGDDAVGDEDLDAVLDNFGCKRACTQGDANNDGAVNSADLNIILGSYGCGL